MAHRKPTREQRPKTSRRPERVRVTSELGAPRTLPPGPGQYRVLHRGGRGADALVLGLGPEPEDAALALHETAPDHGRVRYVECPDFAAQMVAAWAPPEGWEATEPAAIPSLAAGATVLLYGPNPRLFPSFWGPHVAAAQAAALGALPDAAPRPLVVLPGGEGDLLVRELAAAFGEAGREVAVPAADDVADRLPALLGEGAPELFFSVNGRGLDPWGERFHLLRRCGARVALWCVDNPWHVLSGFSAPFWKELELWVTDHSFIPALERAGCRKVGHLPLAADPDLFAAVAPHSADLVNRLVFVGRSSFPNKQGFFSGLRADSALLDEARAMVERGARPDFHWWAERLELAFPEGFWPSKDVRRAGLGAEESARLQRALCLQAAAQEGAVTVFGDEGWRELVPGLSDLRPPVDYYGVLPAVYASASVSLNVTSLLLPAGLTQRHFDVWTAGGFLLTDATPGLSIFPDDLVAPIRFASPADLPLVRARIEGDPALKRHLATAWRTEILARHTYAARVATVLAK